MVSDTLSPGAHRFQRTQPVHQTNVPWPHADISCPFCRVELRQVAHQLREYNRAVPGWRRMFHPHQAFKRTTTNSHLFTPCDGVGRKPHHHHHHHHHHRQYGGHTQHPQQAECKLSSTLRTAAHVHSYDLRQPQSYRVTGATFDGTQATLSDSSESATACRLQGVRVTVEPPEVQYHNGPLSSDSSSSPTNSDPGEGGCSSDLQPVAHTVITNDPS
ncbi:unnamed protein product [Echinostoma caproni]|uniref:LITAF domain-containing protein n=1 Tax=Echinostoma caproni TaxID=27848 RepID=A0A183ARJ4_9TREM|nr:unnamed protein product [Echinostoma caproni]